ncbi:MAG TPA: hypothetical protein VFP55_08870 [Solirubrobacteraceae bacterium]|nr:hypothetical protein [Solirubrobacteraceae bacterium]
MGSEIERRPELELLAASLRADAGDVATFMETLAAKLESTLPGAVSVSRWRARMFGPKSVGRIVVNLGGERLEIGYAQGSGRVEAKRARVSGGVTLSTETISIDSWVENLSEGLVREADSNGQTRQALERLLLG